jgi:hypothetical protein
VRIWIQSDSTSTLSMLSHGSVKKTTASLAHLVAGGEQEVIGTALRSLLQPWCRSVIWSQ